MDDSLVGIAYNSKGKPRSVVGFSSQDDPDYYQFYNLYNRGHFRKFVEPVDSLATIPYSIAYELLCSRNEQLSKITR